MATTPKHVGAKKQKEHIDGRNVHLLVLPEFEFNLTNSML